MRAFLAARKAMNPSDTRRYAALCKLLFLVLLLAILLSLSWGRFSISPPDVLRVLSGAADDPVQHNVIFNLRLPRIGAALLVGMALAVAETVFQGISATRWCRPICSAFPAVPVSARRSPSSSAAACC